MAAKSTAEQVFFDREPAADTDKAETAKKKADVAPAAKEKADAALTAEKDAAAAKEKADVAAAASVPTSVPQDGQTEIGLSREYLERHT